MLIAKFGFKPAHGVFLERYDGCLAAANYTLSQVFDAMFYQF